MFVSKKMSRPTPLKVSRSVPASAKIDLLPREFKLLEYFLRHPGQVVTRAMLLHDVWHYHFSLETNVVDVHISNLRKKIEETPAEPRYLASVRGMGYRFDG